MLHYVFRQWQLRDLGLAQLRAVDHAMTTLASFAPGLILRLCWLCWANCAAQRSALAEQGRARQLQAVRRLIPALQKPITRHFQSYARSVQAQCLRLPPRRLPAALFRAKHLLRLAWHTWRLRLRLVQLTGRPPRGGWLLLKTLLRLWRCAGEGRAAKGLRLQPALIFRAWRFFTRMLRGRRAQRAQAHRDQLRLCFWALHMDLLAGRAQKACIQVMKLQAAAQEPRRWSGAEREWEESAAKAAPELAERSTCASRWRYQPSRWRWQGSQRQGSRWQGSRWQGSRRQGSQRRCGNRWQSQWLEGQTAKKNVRQGPLTRTSCTACTSE
ncbi:unnamed protein product, partial [Effrenium voratum]